MSRDRLRRLLEAHGREAISLLALDAGLEHRFLGDAACLVYHDTGTAWVTVGGPLAASGEAREAAFESARQEAAEAGRRLVWFGVETRPPLPWLRALHVGEQPVWDPLVWNETLASSRSLREQLRRARAKGVRIRHVGPELLRQPDSPIHGQVEELVARWQDGRPMAPMGFLVRADPLARGGVAGGLLVAERLSTTGEPDLVGLLAAVPIPARAGRLFQDVLRDPEAPNGTVELLFDAAMRAAEADGCRYATFGLAPLAGVPSATLAAIRDVSGALYDFEGLRRFKAKLRPVAWRPVFVLHDERTSVARALLEVLRAFAGRAGLWAFGMRTLRHRAPTVAALLAALLVPWTAFLMLVDARHFPSDAVRHAWVYWDVLLGVGLTCLAVRWRSWLARLLAVAAALDLCVGAVQAVQHNVPGLSTHPVVAALELALIGLSLGAPAFAAWFLWTTARR